MYLLLRIAVYEFWLSQDAEFIWRFSNSLLFFILWWYSQIIFGDEDHTTSRVDMSLGSSIIAYNFSYIDEKVKSKDISVTIIISINAK